MMSAPHAAGQVLTHSVYDPASIAKAIEDYRPHLSVSIKTQSATDTVITFAAPNGEGPPEQIVREFLNYALDLSVRTILGAA
jgi:hypothetical protein